MFKSALFQTSRLIRAATSRQKVAKHPLFAEVLKYETTYIYLVDRLFLHLPIHYVTTFKKTLTQ